MYLADNKEKFATAVYRLGQGEQVNIPFIMVDEWREYIKEHVTETLHSRRLNANFIYSTLPFKSTL